MYSDVKRTYRKQIWLKKLGVTSQAVSKCGVTALDISLPPALSTYFAVTIGELLALSDETRMERIQNMLCWFPGDILASDHDTVTGETADLVDGPSPAEGRRKLKKPQLPKKISR